MSMVGRPFMSAGALRVRKRVLDPLEFQVVVSCQCKFSERAVHTPNY